MHRLIPLIVFLDVLFFCLAVYYLRKDKAERKKAKLIRKLSGKRNGKEEPAWVFKQGRRQSRLEQKLSGWIDLSPVESLLVSSAIPISMERFFALSLGLGFLFLVPVLVLFRNPWLMLLAIGAGLSLPFFYLMHRKKMREQALVQMLPDALDMIARALRVGQSVDGALKEVAREFPPPIGTEIRTIYEEMAMGLPFARALRNFQARFPKVPEIRILCTAFIVQRETGGNLTQILQGLSKTVRERFQFKRQVRAMTAEGRASAAILALLPIFFAGFTWMVNPDYIQILFTHPLGKKMLLFSLLLVAAGFGAMRLMTRVDL